jgi:hypothetical protein
VNCLKHNIKIYIETAPTSVCGDVAAYVSGSSLVCVRCTVWKQAATYTHTHTNKDTSPHTELTTHWCILIDYFKKCNFSKHEYCAPWWWCDCTETCRSCFNVSFNIVFKTIHFCISWWIKVFDYIKMLYRTNVKINGKESSGTAGDMNSRGVKIHPLDAFVYSEYVRFVVRDWSRLGLRHLFLS